MSNATAVPEKPLHVRVAEKLGVVVLEDCVAGSEYCDGVWARAINDNPYYAVGVCRECQEAEDLIPKYDLDWAATGPLVERLKLDVTWWDGTWTAIFFDYSQDLGQRDINAFGPSPLLAICNLLLALPDEVVRAEKDQESS